MSTTPAGGTTPRAAEPAERGLFTGLFDDAAVFPPGLAPLPRAVQEHLARRSTSVADLVGPLLVPAAATDELLTLGVTEPLAVVVIGRPGVSTEAVGGAVARLREHPLLTVDGVELGWAPGWEQALTWQLPVSVEVPHGDDQPVALRELAAVAARTERLQAKLRTGATATTATPSPAELAGFLRGCVDLDLGFKLTGGLHHALTHTSTEGEDQFGFLNVLCAVRWVLNGADAEELEPLLTQRDPAPVLEMVARMSAADASITRAFFTAYGCCGVMDPIGDLSALGLIEETTV